MPYYGFTEVLFRELEKLKRSLQLQPIVLGAIPASGGGLPGRPGGFIGYLPQTRVAYDLSEVSTSGTSGSPTLLDNLNHIRYRVTVLESGGVSGGIESIENDDVVVGTDITVLDFSDNFTVTESPTGEANITIDFTSSGIDDRYVNVTGDTMIGALNIEGSSDEVQLLVKQYSSQSSNIFEVQDSSGNADILIINSNEQVGFGTTTTDIKVSIQDGSGTTLTPALRLTKAIDGDGSATGILFGAVSSGAAKAGIFFENKGVGGGRGNLYIAMDNISDSNDVDITNISITVDRTGNLGIGETIPTAKLHVVGTTRFIGSADAVQLTVKANATQNTNITEWENSSGNIDISFLNGGAVFNKQGNSVNFIIGSNTEDKLFLVEGSVDEVRMGDGDTNYTVIDKEGDVNFVGTAGLNYGHSYGESIGWVQVSGVQNTWYAISDTSMFQLYSNNMTHDGSGKLTIQKAGHYIADWAGSFIINATGKNIEIAFRLNGSSIDTGINDFDSLSTTGEFPVSGNAILDLAVNDTVEMSIRTTSTGQPNLAVENLMFRLVQIGGT